MVMKILTILICGLLFQTLYPQQEEMNYKLIFFDEKGSLKSVERRVKVKPKLKREEKIKIILNDLLSYPTDVLKHKKLSRPIKAKVNVLDVKTWTETKKLPKDVTITHKRLLVELSRDIIPHLNDVTVEEIGTLIRWTLESSGYDFTAFDIKVKDKKGILRSLMHFVDNPE